MKQQQICILFIFFIAFCITKISSTGCQAGSIEIQNSCYFFQLNPANYGSAESHCRTLFGKLVSIHDGWTNAILNSEGGKAFTENNVADFWIGLNNATLSGNWEWTDNSTFDFKEWAPSEPQNSCASLNMENGLWATDDCITQKPFVCNIPPRNPPSNYCPPGKWEYFDQTNSCYGGNYEYATNWTFAEKYCESEGGFLTSIHSVEEAKFVSALEYTTNIGLWIGLFSNDNQATWQWSDGTQTDYLPWANFNPHLQVSSCVYIYNNNFYDYHCKDFAFGVCKKAASPQLNKIY